MGIITKFDTEDHSFNMCPTQYIAVTNAQFFISTMQLPIILRTMDRSPDSYIA